MESKLRGWNLDFRKDIYDWKIEEWASISNLFKGFCKAFNQIIECRELAAKTARAFYDSFRKLFCSLY